MSTPTPSPFRLDGLIAVVTGGATGIGAMISNSLITAGASKVYILSRRPFTPPHPSQQHIQCDITSKDSLLSAVSQIEKESGHINLLVANSGIVGPILRFDPNLPITQIRKNLFSDISMEAFTNVLHVNTTSTFFTVTAFLELLDRGNQNAIRGGEGAYGAPLEAGKEAGVPSVQSQVIVTSSVAGMMRIQQSFPAYAASKAASLHLVKVMSSAFVGYGIRVNALVPGWFPSEMSNQFIEGRDPGTETPDSLFWVPARRFGGEEEMGGTVVYLASRAGSYCNGMVMVNDGGKLAVSLLTY